MRKYQVLAKAWTYLKLLYLYLLYWLVGVGEGWFYWYKGKYLLDLNYFAAAAKAFERALDDESAPYLHASLGYCYLCLRDYDKAITNLKKALAKREDPDSTLHLIYAYYGKGDKEESVKLYDKLLQDKAIYPPEFIKALNAIEELIKRE